MHLTLALPELRIRASVPYDPCDGLALDALRELLGRGDGHTVTETSFDAWLRNSFNAGDVGVADVTRRVDMPDREAGFWMRADPVHLRPDRDRVMLFDAGVLQLQDVEAQALIAALNMQFAADGMVFHFGSATRWYVRLDRVPALTTVPLAQVVGQDIHPHLPKGPEALQWHRLLNEVQMFLYTHAVNDARDASGRPAANSVWFWGEGRAAVGLASPFKAVMADDAWARGLGQGAGVLTYPLANGFDASDGRLSDGLVVIDRLAQCAMRGDIAAWRDALQALEQGWFKPLLAAWQSGKIESLRLVLPGAGDVREIVLSRSARWKIWRRPLALANVAH
ncbi:MAG: hypothetical protein JO218_11860 [Burkholderiales bacterium]|nr:hypothetical protein [Burkholderiales bacterium]